MADNIVLSFHDCLLRQSDLNLLSGPFWLNDQIISFYFEYLTKNLCRTRSNLLFVSPEVTQCLKMVSVEEIGIFLEPLDAKNKDVVFFALNDNELLTAGGSHWSLLVFCKAENTFHHFDSASPLNRSVGQQVYVKLKGYLGESAVLKEENCLQQSNGMDCGVHVICEAEHIANHVKRSIRLDNVADLQRVVVDKCRENLLAIIESLCKDETNPSSD